MSLLLPLRVPEPAAKPSLRAAALPHALDGPFVEPELRPFPGPVRVLAWIAAAVLPWTAIAAVVALVW